MTTPDPRNQASPFFLIGRIERIVDERGGPTDAQRIATIREALAEWEAAAARAETRT